MLNGIDELTHAGVFVIFSFFFELLLVAETIMPNLSRTVGVILIRRDNVDNAVEPFFPFSIYGVTIPAPVHITQVSPSLWVKLDMISLLSL